MHLKVRTEKLLGSLVVDANANTNKSAVYVRGQGTGHGLEAIGGATGNDIDGRVEENFLRVNTAQAGGADNAIVLDASASGSNDWYNGTLVSILEGTGAGQQREITDYVGGTVTATVDSDWVTNPDATSIFAISAGPDIINVAPAAELSSMPNATASWADKLQFLWQRQLFRRTETAVQLKMFKDDTSTELAKCGYKSSGGTEEYGKMESA
jgi:hypothetical protein